MIKPPGADRFSYCQLDLLRSGQIDLFNQVSLERISDLPQVGRDNGAGRLPAAGEPYRLLNCSEKLLPGELSLMVDWSAQISFLDIGQ
jgi:hypothetical protein